MGTASSRAAIAKLPLDSRPATELAGARGLHSCHVHGSTFPWPRADDVCDARGDDVCGDARHALPIPTVETPPPS